MTLFPADAKRRIKCPRCGRGIDEESYCDCEHNVPAWKKETVYIRLREVIFKREIEKDNDYDYETINEAVRKLERHFQQNGPGDLVCLKDEVIIEGNDDFVECQELESEYVEEERSRHDLKRRFGLA